MLVFFQFAPANPQSWDRCQECIPANGHTGFCCGKRCHIHWDMIQIDTSTAKIINNQKSSAMGKKSNNACSGCHAPKTPTTRRGSEITRNCARFSRKNKNQMGRSLRTPVRKWWITHICLYHDKNTYIIDLNVNMYLYIYI